MQIKRPTLIIDQDKVVANVKKMLKKLENSKTSFRPHFKTHQSSDVGEWLRELGVNKITVSSVKMAEYFAKNDWDDITIAFPVNIREIDEINNLALKINLGLLVESDLVIDFLSTNLSTGVNCWIKIDVGYRRTGIPWDKHDEILELARHILNSPKLRFSGLLTHAGHSYHMPTKKEKIALHNKTINRLNKIRTYLEKQGISDIKLSTGDTPTASIVESFEGIDEIRPGNFVFYDLAQVKLGSCQDKEIACVVACPVVAKHKQRNELVIYGGKVHFSKDFLEEEDGIVYYGKMAEKTPSGWGGIIEGCYMRRISQEHGMIKVTDEIFNDIDIGDIIYVFPVTANTTVHVIDKIITKEGEKLEKLT